MRNKRADQGTPSGLEMELYFEGEEYHASKLARLTAVLQSTVLYGAWYEAG